MAKRVLTGPDSKRVGPYSLTATGVLFTEEMTGYESVSVQVTSAGSSCTITYETSDDGFTWVSSSGLASVSASAASATSTAAGLVMFPRRGLFFRARVSTYGSGTVTAYATLHRSPVNIGIDFSGTGAALLAKAEDAAHASGDTGIAVWGVRNDGAATSYGANNDYAPMAVDAFGRSFSIPGAYSASATFTPAAASHTAGDVNGTAAEFALAAPSASRVRIVSATLEIDGGTIETTAWRVHLFNVTPPSALADDAAFTLAAGDRASYLGWIDLAQVIDLGDTLYIEATNIQKIIKLAGTSVFGYLVNGTTLTPQAAAHIVTLHCEAV